MGIVLRTRVTGSSQDRIDPGTGQAGDLDWQAERADMHRVAPGHCGQLDRQGCRNLGGHDGVAGDLHRPA